MLNPARPAPTTPLPFSPLIPGNPSSTEALVEHVEALSVLSGATATRDNHHKSSHAKSPRHARPKKGKPLPKGQLIQLLKDTRGWNIVLAGPDFIGISTLLRELEQLGYHVRLQHHKPSTTKRLDFHLPYFNHLVSDWTSFCADSRALLIEDSPWAYLCRHTVHIAPEIRDRCHSTLAPLKLPDFTIIFSTSGIEIGRRHQSWTGTPESYSPHALR